MPDVIVTHEDSEDPSVLAQAAVASAAVAGASIAKAEGASDDAAEAKQLAQEAQSSANAAASMAASQPVGLSEEEARRIAREESERYLGELAAKAAATPPVVDNSAVDAQVQQPLPKSAEKAGGGEKKGKRGGWAKAWLGEE
jgi:hypothetical protein